MFHRSMSMSLAALLATACAGNEPESSEEDPTCAGAKCDDPNADERSVCAAIRGNGQLVFAHFASLARIVEHYGPLHGAAGGSSASITIFLTESIQSHPAVTDCAGATCSPREQANRIALLFKSLQGYAVALTGTPEALAVQHLAPLAARVQEAGIASLAETDIEAARDALLELLQSEDLRDLVNQEVLDVLLHSPDPEFHVRDIVGALTSFGDFRSDDPAILVRPGVLDFEAFAEKIGRIGSFYAGEGPLDDAAMQAFMTDCAEAGRGLDWLELASLPTEHGTCGEAFTAVLTDWREGWLTNEGDYPSRIDDRVGQRLPALVSTSVLQDGAAAVFEQARADYLEARPFSFDGIDFADVRFGYWGDQGDLDRVAANPRGYDDAKTAKLLTLGQVTWREALSFSPAEPGLARALELDEQLVSAGGWSDLHPVFVLKNLGCDEVIYVTRRGPESGFATGVATLLGMQPEDHELLYDLDAPSSYTRSIEEADAVWCTDWNSLQGTDIVGVYAHAYNAPLESTSAFFAAADDAYPGLVERTGHPGCTLAVAAAD
jgi:hypothetical protein